MKRIQSKLKSRKPRVVILATPGTMLTSVATGMDVFSTAGVMWNRITRVPDAPVFDVQLVSPDGRPVPCNGVPSLGVHGAMTGVKDADLVIITALVGQNHDRQQLGQIVQWLREKHESGSALASFCTGAFLLAATGLLDGKDATTHWGQARKLQRMYPRVKVTPHRLLTDDGTLFTSGGSHGAMNLCLHLVERFASREIAVQSAKVMVRDFELKSQSPFATFLRDRDHSDNEIAQAQDYLECAYHQSFQTDRLAERVGLGRRTFERRFRTATGASLREYIQSLRIEAAKRILESENHSVEQIAEAVGYTDPATFSKLFTRRCGVAPSAYRRKFASF